MEYTLITPTGKIMCFHIKSVAEMYQRLKGGVLMDSSLHRTSTPQVAAVI